MRTLIVLLMLLALAPAAHAAICTMSTSPLMFGNYHFDSGLDVDTTATVSIECNNNDGGGTAVNYTIAIGAGNSGSFSDRAMNGLGGTLHYNLYADAARTLVWGDGTGGSVDVAGGFVAPGIGAASHTAYGRIPARQAEAEAGVYSDQLAILVTY